MAVERPAPAPPPAPARGRRAVWLGAAVTVLVLGALIWRFAPLTPGPAPTPTPGVPTARPTAVLQDTPTPLAGAATFTPVPGTAGAGPQVLGITAGVGMRAGDVAGAASIAVTFSEAMDPASAQAAFALQPAVAGTFHWQQTTLLFEPSAPLAPATVYTASIATTARTASGQPIVAPLSAGFQTAPPPTILRTLPSAGASEVPTDTIVTITFNVFLSRLTSSTTPLKLVNGPSLIRT